MKKPNQIRAKDNSSNSERRDELLAARDALENATLCTSALLEAFGVLIELSEKSEQPRLSGSAVEGLQYIALEEGANLRERFENYAELLRRN